MDVPLDGDAMTAVAGTAADERVPRLIGECERVLQGCMDDYPGLFPAKPFHDGFARKVAVPNAVSSPHAAVGDLRVVLRESMWNFAIDYLIDTCARSGSEVAFLVRQSMALADGTEAPPAPAGLDMPVDQLARFLVEIRDDLAAVPGFRLHGGIWRTQLERWLTCQAVEFGWKRDLAEGRPPPTFADYLNNADNFGTTWVNLGHWLFVGDQATFAHLDELWAASQRVQQVLRLLNDRITLRRDREWGALGDLNALMLVDRDIVDERIGDLTREAQGLLADLREPCPTEAFYLKRQLEFSAAFYAGEDYWGPLT